MKQFPKRITILILIICVTIIFGYFFTKNEGEDANDSGMDKQNTSDVTFPYITENNLSLDSLFQFTGLNPDEELEEGENIAGLTVVNVSNRHLLRADIEVQLDNGKTLNFVVQDLPVGKSVNVFENDNNTFDLINTCKLVSVNADFLSENVMLTDKVSVETEETNITIKNITDEKMTHLVVHCHCMLDDTYFGGLTYNYPVDSIEAGESIVIEAVDCYLGQAEVVRITEDNVDNK